MSLFGTVKANIESVLTILFEDAELAKEITYKNWVKSEFDSGLKQNVDEYITTTPKAIRTEHTAESAKRENVQAGMKVFIIRFGGMPAKPSVKDQIWSGDEVFAPVDFENVFDLVYVVTVEASTV